jgi:hypothetical protein
MAFNSSNILAIYNAPRSQPIFRELYEEVWRLREENTNCLKYSVEVSEVTYTGC